MAFGTRACDRGWRRRSTEVRRCTRTQARCGPDWPGWCASGWSRPCTGDRLPLVVTAWVAPGEPVPFAEARAQRFTPFAVGSPWGRPWGTVWFHVTGDGCPGGAGTSPNSLVDLGLHRRAPGFQAEGLVYAADGTVLSGIAPLRRHVALRAPTASTCCKLAPGRRADRLVRRGGGEPEHRRRLGLRAHAARRPRDRGRRAALPPRRRRRRAARPARVGAARRRPGARRPGRASCPPTCRGAPRCCARWTGPSTSLDPDDVVGHGRGRPRRAGRRAGRAGVRRARTGCTPSGTRHIDSAWLWPVRETARKVRPHVRERRWR